MSRSIPPSAPRERGGPALKLLDRWIGVPLVWLAGLWVRASRRLGAGRRDREQLIRDLGKDAPMVRFTLLKTAAIGDTVLLSAAVRDLRRLYPRGVIYVACGPSNVAAAKLIAGIDEVVCLPMRSPPAISRCLGSVRADVFIDFDSWPRINALIAFLSGSRLTIGFRTQRQFRHRAFHEVVDHDPLLHEVENYRNLIRRLGALAGKTVDGPARPSLCQPAGAGKPHRLPAPYAVLHMFSGGSQAGFKEWAPANWHRLVAHLSGLGLPTHLCGGPSDTERNVAFVAAVGSFGHVSCLPPCSLGELVPLLQAASVVISVDTGIAHLAAAYGAPTVVLHGPTSPARWGAMGDKVFHVKDGQTPWISLGFERSDGGRPVALRADEVFPVVDAALACAGPLQRSSTAPSDVHDSAAS